MGLFTLQDFSVLSINKTTFGMNKGFLAGAIGLSNQTAMTLTECIFMNNSAVKPPLDLPPIYAPYARLGGVITIYQSFMLLKQCEFKDNPTSCTR